jgi:hypothetical protein
MVNWKKLLKKHLKISKNNRPLLTILDHSKYEAVYDLTNTTREINGEDILLILSLQGEERVLDFQIENSFNFPSDTRFHYNSIYEHYQYTFIENNIWIHILITRYSLFSSDIIEDVETTQYQGFDFQILTKTSSTTFENFDLFNSGLIFPVEGNSGKVLHNDVSNNKVELYIEDIKGNYISILTTPGYNNIKYKINNDPERFIIFYHNNKKKYKSSDLFEQYQNLSNEGYYYNSYVIDSNIIATKSEVVVEHNWFGSSFFILKRLISNLANVGNKPVIHKEILFYMIINNNYLTAHIKQSDIKLNETFNPGILGNVELKLLKLKGGVPYLWSVKIKGKCYNLVPKQKENYKFVFMVYDEIIYSPVDIFLQDSKVGVGWIQYKHFVNNSKIIDKKLKRLYTPFDRPDKQLFKLKLNSVKSVIPSILFLIFYIVIFVTFLISIYFIIKCNLFPSRS